MIGNFPAPNPKLSSNSPLDPGYELKGELEDSKVPSAVYSFHSWLIKVLISFALNLGLGVQRYPKPSTVLVISLFKCLVFLHYSGQRRRENCERGTNVQSMHMLTLNESRAIGIFSSNSILKDTDVIVRMSSSSA